MVMTKLLPIRGDGDYRLLDDNFGMVVNRLMEMMMKYTTPLFAVVCIIIVGFSSSAYLCPHCWGTGLPYGLHIRRTGHNPSRGPSVGWLSGFIPLVNAKKKM
jgi:hypothetical protein